MESDLLLVAHKHFFWLPKRSSTSKQLIWLTWAYSVREDVYLHEDFNFYEPGDQWWYTDKEFTFFLLSTNSRIAYE